MLPLADLSTLLSSPFVAGTLMVLASGALASHALSIPTKLLGWIKQRLLFTVEVDNTDPAYQWIKPWLAEKSSSRFLMANAVFPPDSPTTNQWGGQPGTRRVRPKFALCPRGICTFHHDGKRILAWVEKTEAQGTNQYREKIVLQAVRADKGYFRRLLNEAYDEAMESRGKAVEIWLPDGNGWLLADHKSIRPISSLVFAEDLAERIASDARQFLSSREWYLKMGIPYRRGYLLSGPPGNGKSSLVHALASELGMSISVLSLSMFGNDRSLVDSLVRVPRGHIVLLEDVDAAWRGRESSSDGRLTFSGLLNAIDGVAAQEGRILVMTTNHKEKLDPALIRPGRADVHLHLGDATAQQAEQMFARFFPSQSSSDARMFGEKAAGSSMAKIQEMLLEHRDAPEFLLVDADADLEALAA